MWIVSDFKVLGSHKRPANAGPGEGFQEKGLRGLKGSKRQFPAKWIF